MAQVRLHEFDLTPTRQITLREMGTEDLLRAYELAGQTANESAANLKTKLAALCLCVVEDGKDSLTYADLQGPGWDQRFSLKDTFKLARVWSMIHEPEAEEMEGKLRARSGA